MSEKKVCEECNTLVDMNETICPNCCGSIFRIVEVKNKENNKEDIVLDDSEFYRGQSTYEQLLERMEPRKNKKKSGILSGMGNSKVISCIVGMIVAAMGLVARNGDVLRAFSKGYRVVNKFNQVSEKSNSYKKSSLDSNVKGEIVNGVYTNVWLGTKLIIPQGYSNAPDSTYRDEESDIVNCGLYLIDSRGNSIIADFLDLSDGYETYTVKKYLNELSKELESNKECEYTKVASDSINIAGKKFETVHFRVNDSGISYTQSFYAYKKEKVLVLILVTNSTSKIEYCNSLARLFKEYNIGM